MSKVEKLELKEKPTYDVELVFEVRDKPEYPCALKGLGLQFQAYYSNFIRIKPVARGEGGVSEGWITTDDLQDFIDKLTEIFEEFCKLESCESHKPYISWRKPTEDP